MLVWFYNNKLTSHTGAKTHILSKNSQIKNHIIQEIHIFKITIFKIAFLQKSHFFQKSHFQNLISHINHDLEANFSQKSHFQNFIFQKNYITSNIKFKWIYGLKVWFCPSVHQEHHFFRFNSHEYHLATGCLIRFVHKKP